MARHVTTPTTPAPPTTARTNAGMFARGDRATSPTTGPPPRRWDYWPRAVRTALDVAGAVLAFGALVAYRADPPAATRGALVLAGVALVVAGWVGAGAALTRRHRRDVVRPLARALGPALGRHEHERPGGWLDVPSAYADGEPVTIRLPHRMDEGTRRTVEAATATHLGGDLAHDWHASGRRPRVVIRPRQHPPTSAIYDHDDDATRAVADAPEPAPAIGLTTGGAVVAVDLDAESPGILVSAAPGGGKSTVLRTITAQVLHNGGLAVILDLKKKSHPAFKGLPNVAYARDVIEAHAALVAVGDEVERRNALDDEDPAAAAELPRLLVLVEEANTTIARLKRYHERTRERGGDKTSPALDALGETLFMGRAARVHVLMVAQSGTVHALGGPEVRECFAAARIVSRYSRNAWGMLVPEHPYQPASHHPGRATVVTSGRQPRATQVIYLDDDHARELATTGRALDAGSAVLSLPGWGSFHQGGRPGDVPTRGPRLTVVPALPGADVEPAPRVYSLSEAAAEGVLPMTYGALKRARTRDQQRGTFPTPDVEGPPARYLAATLERWHRGRDSTPPSDADYWSDAPVIRRPTPRAAGTEGGQ